MDAEAKIPEQSRAEVRFVASQPGLADAARRLSAHAVVAGDLEADSMFHFNERICLLQLAAGEHIYVIDPLAVSDMSPIGKIMENDAIRKVFHGADYDVRCLFRDYGISISNLFDTEMAGRFLGYAETGLEALIRKQFGICLEKKFQKRDWSQRPLPGEMINYAADDVRYLEALYSLLEKKLEEKNRLCWVLEECSHIAASRPEQKDEAPLFTRCKGAGRLDPRSLAVLEALLRMRMEKARKKDRPQFKILANAALIKLAQTRPKSMKKLQSANILSKKQLQMYGDEILSAIQEGASLSPAELPRYPRAPRPACSAEATKYVRRIKRWREKEARRLAMDPGTFLSNAQIKAIAEKAPSSANDLNAVTGMKKWQIKEYGEKLVEVIHKGRPHE